MERTPDEEIVDQAWYWVLHSRHEKPVVMQAWISEAVFHLPREITWWEVMKDWETQHDEIEVVGPRILEPKE